MNPIYLGIDVSKARLDVALVLPDACRTHQVANSPQGFSTLQDWLCQYTDAPVRVGLEATGRYSHAAARFFHQQHHAVYLLNPLQVKALGRSRLQRNKTDKLDARLIADFVAVNHPEPYTPPDEAQQQLRDTYRRREQLLNIRQQERNRLKAGCLDAFAQHSLQAHLGFLDHEIEGVETHLKQLAQQPSLDHDYQLLCSIPGIGHLTAVALLSEIQNWHAFDQVNQVVAYAGLNPRLQQSGNHASRHTPISKLGNVRLRRALYFPAINAKRFNPSVKALARRMTDNGKTKMQINCAAMKKLLQLAYGVLKSGRPFDPLWGNSITHTP